MSAYDLYAPQLHASGHLNLIAGGDLREYEVGSRHIDFERTQKSRSFFGLSIYRSEYSSRVEHDLPLVTRLVGQDGIYSASGGDTAWLAPSVTGHYHADIGVGEHAREDARLSFNGVVERHASEQHHSRSGALWMSAEGQGQTTETLHHGQMDGAFTTNATHIDVRLRRHRAARPAHWKRRLMNWAAAWASRCSACFCPACSPAISACLRASMQRRPRRQLARSAMPSC